jgi:hypothetical protein
VPQPPQNSPLPGSAAPQLVQKGFGDEIVPLGTPVLLDLFAPNLRTILRIRMEAIASRISPRKLSVGIINSPGVRATVPSAKAVEQNRRVKGGRRRGLRGCSATVALLRVQEADLGFGCCPLVFAGPLDHLRCPRKSGYQHINRTLQKFCTITSEIRV